MTNLLGAILLPSSIAYILLAIGLLSTLWTATRRYSGALLIAPGILLTFFSSGVVATILMSPLEHSHSTLKDPSSYPAATHIVVLTAWATDDPDMPTSGRLNASAAYRVLLALDLSRRCADCGLILSGDRRTAHIMADVLIESGVDAARIRLEDRSTSTFESARNLKAMIGSDQFFLVTSGGHMPRTLTAARAFGLNAVPAPTDHKLPKRWQGAQLLPSSNHLTYSDLAVHEWIGWLWYRILAAL